MAKTVSFEAGKQKGNIVLIVLVIVALMAGGAFLYGKGKLNLNSGVPTSSSSSYALSPSAPDDTETVSTSDKISLVITSPALGSVLKSSNVTINGKTSPNAEVFVNDASTKADANGNFTLNVSLDEGENTLIINANDEFGNVAEQTLTVNVQTLY